MSDDDELLLRMSDDEITAEDVREALEAVNPEGVSVQALREMIAGMVHATVDQATEQVSVAESHAALRKWTEALAAGRRADRIAKNAHATCSSPKLRRLGVDLDGARRRADVVRDRVAAVDARVKNERKEPEPER